MGRGATQEEAEVGTGEAGSGPGSHFFPSNRSLCSTQTSLFHPEVSVSTFSLPVFLSDLPPTHPPGELLLELRSGAGSSEGQGGHQPGKESCRPSTGVSKAQADHGDEGRPRGLGKTWGELRLEKHTGLRDLDLRSRWPQKGSKPQGSRRRGKVVESFMLQSLQETHMGGRETS